MRILVWELWDDRLMWKIIGREMYVDNYQAWAWYSFRRDYELDKR